MPIRAHSLKVALLSLMLCGLSLLSPSHACGQADFCGRPVAVGFESQYEPQVVQVFNGHTFVTWQDNRSPTATAIYSALFDPAGNPAPGWPVNGVQLTPDSTRSSVPQAIMISEDAVLVVWHRDRTIGWDVHSALFVRTAGQVPTAADAILDTLTWRGGGQYLRALIPQDDQHALALILNSDGPKTLIKQISLPGAPATAWPTFGATLTDTALGTFPQTACGDDSLGCFVLTMRTHPGCVNIPLKVDCPYDVRIWHFLPDGTLDPAWPGGNVLVTEQSNWSNTPEVVSDRHGGAYVKWTYATPDTVRVYGTHIRGDGTVDPGWGPGGLVLVPTSSDIQEFSNALLKSAPSGALLTLIDDHAGPRLGSREADGTTTPGWPEGGVLLPFGPEYPQWPHGHQLGIAADGRIIIIWSVGGYRDPADSDIYGTALSPDGALLPGWSPTGTSLNRCTRQQERASLFVGSDGTFSSAWQGGNDVYYDRFNISDGTVPTLSFARLLDHALIGRSVHATWQLAGAAASAVTALRALDDSAFELIAPPRWIGASSISLDDAIPVGSTRARYVLTAADGSSVRPVSDTLEVRVEAAAVRLALRAPTIQRGGILVLELNLPDPARPVDITVYDLAGRRVHRTRLAQPVPGVQQLHLRLDSPAPGVYLVEARGSGGQQALLRIVLLD